jgi:hypothetical protein
MIIYAPPRRTHRNRPQSRVLAEWPSTSVMPSPPSRCFQRSRECSPRPRSGPPTWAGRRPPRKAYQGTVSRTRQLAATKRIPAHRDANGNFYYSLNHLEMTRRAWQAAKDFDEL